MTLVVALVWLGERPRALELVGGLLGIAGVVLIHRWRPAAGGPRESEHMNDIIETGRTTGKVVITLDQGHP